MLYRFSIRIVLRMHRKGIAKRMLQSNEFSFGIPGGVRIVILGCTVARMCNSTWYIQEIDFSNAHYDCSRRNIWDDLERDSYFHFLIHIFLNLYGETCTPQ